MSVIFLSSTSPLLFWAFFPWSPPHLISHYHGHSFNFTQAIDMCGALGLIHIHSENFVSVNFINKQKIGKSLFARGQVYLRNGKVLNTAKHLWRQEIVTVLLFCTGLPTHFLFKGTLRTAQFPSLLQFGSPWIQRSPHWNSREFPWKFCQENFKTDRVQGTTWM